MQTGIGWRTGRTDREGKLVEIFLHRDWRSDRRHRTVLGGLYNCQPAGNAVSVRNFFHQHVRLLVDRLLAHASHAADGMESGVEIPGAHRISWRLQHVFFLRMGDIFHGARRRLLDGRPVRVHEYFLWTSSSMVRCFPGRGNLMKCHGPRNVDARFILTIPRHNIAVTIECGSQSGNKEMA